MNCRRVCQTACKLHSVLWSNETQLLDPMDLQYVWRKKNEAYAEKNTLSTVKHGGLGDALGVF